MPRARAGEDQAGEARIKSEILLMQLQLKESDDSNLGKGQCAAGLSKKVSTHHLASMRDLHNRRGS